MNLKAVFILLFLFTAVMLVGCYTKLGYYEPTYLKEKQVEKTKEKVEHASNSDVETEGYYGRRRPTYRSSYTPVRDSFWVPYAAYYPPIYYYPHTWYYGSMYYGYYPSYYPYYRRYYPYRGYYGSTYLPASRGTYKRGAVLRESRRSRFSRSVTSSNPQSDRPQRRSRNRNDN